ncbi:MAG: amino acid permease [Alphaproteobacteria bacterium]|nr:amino acid permease [Alphaproteobacteria bacterium]
MEDRTTSPAPRLGVFLGVYTPTILTILGVIMYLRSAWVVGNVGPIGAVAIVVIANSITLLTALSMSALATSMRVGVGGAYYLISRSFGLGVGGAIGIPLYLSQALSVTLYAYGLAEVTQLVVPSAPVPVVAAVVVAAVGAVAARSTRLTLLLQLPIMGLIFLSLASLFGGVPWGTGFKLPAFGGPGGEPFWTVFAVFFPAVTGILAGVSLSGDLRDPGRAIPLGSLAAVFTGFAVYLAVPFALATALDRETLLTQRSAWTLVASVPWLVFPGMVGAILSSAFGSILGAPRTLQALARDGLVPLRFADTDEAGEPVVALRFTAVVAFVAVFLGDLNLVATVLSMVFLTTYGMLNLVAGTEALVRDPSYRPRIRVPWWASFLGAFGCLAAMLLISPAASIVAVLVEVAVFWTLRRRALRATWGDVRTGVWFTAARWSLEGLNHARHDPRNWRPHLLVFTAELSRSLALARFADDFGQQRGIVTVCTLRMGDLEDIGPIDEDLARHRALLAAHGVVAFPEIAAVPDFESGVVTVSQANGYAGLASNTALFGWPQDPAGLARLLGLSRKLGRLEKCTVVARLNDSGHPAPPGQRPRAVVWWKGRESNGDLMLLMAYLLSLSDHWRGLRIVLRSIVADADAARDRKAELEAMVPELRMDVEADVIIVPPEETTEALVRHSADASIVFLGLPHVPRGEEEAYADRLHALVVRLPTAVLVRNAGPFRGRLV